MQMTTYSVAADATTHTCWIAETWNGTLDAENCAGCAQAAEHPCNFCNYGVTVGYHVQQMHRTQKDSLTPHTLGQYSQPQEIARYARWSESPHIYQEEENV